MKFSLRWLTEFVAISISPEELAARLTQAGFEVEGIHLKGGKLKGIVVGRIEAVAKHPNADRLSITTVSDGKQTHQIVTGATNIFEGAIVPVSLPGSVLADGTVLKASKLRGVESFGMLCSQKELGVAEESQGIWILPESTPIGADLVDYLGLSDAILDVSVLPHRGDCLSHMGLAREIAAILDVALKMPEINLKTVVGVPVAVGDTLPGNCERYTARAIRGSVAGPSPLWLQQRLSYLGFRPINLAVDITNYVLLERGQPLHAFDADKIQGKIVVRTTSGEERLVTLDGVARTLPVGTLVIADDSGPIAVAGVMGGLSTAVTEATRRVILEAATFEPVSVRKTAVALGLRTESAIRFEKGTATEGVIPASNRAAQLFETLAAAEVGELRDVQNPVGQPAKRLIPFELDDINQFLETDFSAAEAWDALARLGFEVGDREVKAPFWRRDVHTMPDLAEEIARLLGYQRIPEKPLKKWMPIQPRSRLRTLADELRRALRSQGLYEVCSFPMIGPDDFLRLGLESTPKQRLKNALNPNESILRPCLLASLLKIFQYNRNRQMPRLRIFEIGNVFSGDGAEALQAAFLVSGTTVTAPYLSGDRSAATDFFSLKAQVEIMFRQLGFANPQFEHTENPWFFPGKAVDITLEGKVLGQVGVLHPMLSKAYDADEEIGVAMWSVSALSELPQLERVFKPFTRQPVTVRDSAFLLPAALDFRTVYQEMLAIKPQFCREIRLFDYFAGENLGEGKKSLAFSFVYGHDERSLSDDEVNQAHEKFVGELTEKLGIARR